jgi:uncharacterized membrane protein YgcG
MWFVRGLLAAALVAASPSYFAGPARSGESVTYRVTTTMGAQETPNVSTLVITWTPAAHMFARLAGASGAAVLVNRENDGSLSLAVPNPVGSAAPTIVVLLGQLNFPGHLAGALNGSDHAQTAMSITPPAPTSTSSPAPQTSPAPVVVPLDVNLVRSSTGATLIADGNSKQNGASRSGREGRGGSTGGWRSGGSGRSRSDSAEKTSIVDIAVEAVFDQSGTLEHSTYRETFTSATNSSQTVEHTITIDRVK